MKRVNLILKVIIVGICSIVIPFSLVMFCGLLGFDSDTATREIGFGYLALFVSLVFILYITLKNVLKTN